MDKHVCKRCQGVYEYCRGCLLRPVSYKENGYCSKQCEEVSKIKIEEVIPTEDVEVVINENEDMTIS